MTIRPRVRLAPAGSLVALSALALVYALFSLNNDVRAAAEQPDVAAISSAMAAAQSVVVATPRSVQSAWRENEHGDQIIQSEVLLDVSETLKGRSERSRLVRIEGGTVDGITLEVSGEPDVRIGARGVFMLDPVRQDLDRLHPAHESMLSLDEHDVVRGTSLRLDDLRRHARGQGR